MSEASEVLNLIGEMMGNQLAPWFGKGAAEVMVGAQGGFLVMTHSELSMSTVFKPQLMSSMIEASNVELIIFRTKMPKRMEDEKALKNRLTRAKNLCKTLGFTLKSKWQEDVDKTNKMERWYRVEAVR